ncbi:hypothetical protein [Streptosporangium sp. KLBMP 9127]|nr:hypothetical protein [Streptosporangium sp. KLBMP 9127]
MNLDSLVKRGRLPWRPGSEVYDLDVWHEYEIPLTGTFRVGADLVMFTQVLESSHGLSAWAYVCVRPEESEEFGDVTFGSTDELRGFVEATFLDREAVLTLARDDRIIDRWTRSDVTNGLVPTVEGFLNRIIGSVNDVENTERRVGAKFAGLEAALT